MKYCQVCHNCSFAVTLRHDAASFIQSPRYIILCVNVKYVATRSTRKQQAGWLNKPRKLHVKLLVITTMKSTWRSLCIATIVAASLFSTGHSYTITVDAHAEECFFENVEADTKMGEF